MHFLSLSVLATFLLAAPASCWVQSKGPYYQYNPRFLIHTTLKSFDDREMVSWAVGGGDVATIVADSHHPFAGRDIGSANRSTIRGTRAFGSGYPFGVYNDSTVAGRPFPYGTWPLWWPNNLTGSSEYGPALDLLRPGGQLVAVPVKTDMSYWNVSETYYTIADRDSSVAVMNSLVTWCAALPAWPTPFDPTNNATNSTTSPNLQAQNVIRYYRASSFALAYANYTNAWASNTTTEVGEDASTPLPETVILSPFRTCIDGVIADAVPILDRGYGYYNVNQPPSAKQPLYWLPWGIPLIIIFGGPFVCGLISCTVQLIGAACGWDNVDDRRRAQLRTAGHWYEAYP